MKQKNKNIVINELKKEDIETDKENYKEIKTDKGNDKEIKTDKGNDKEIKTDKGNDKEIEKDKGNDKEIKTDKGNDKEIEKDNKSIKKKLGQFYTTNYKYILTDLEVPKNVKKIIEPFCGNGDLLNFIDKKKYICECYDIDPKHKYISKRDTIKNPPKYSNSFIITNPPYLSRNKSKQKELFDDNDVNDLYKCHIKNLLDNNPIGGIIIIPLNFFCSIRNMDIELRKKFLNTYIIKKLNIFEEKVFDDTTYTVCSFQYEYKPNSNQSIPITIYPSKKKLNFLLNEDNNYTIGGEIYNISNNEDYKIGRLLEKEESNTNLLLKAIDDNENSKIKLEYVSNEKIYYGKISSRTYATLTITPSISEDIQKKIAIDFNNYLDDKRDKYNSLFLTNFRESKKIARKRISFDLAYKIVGMLLQKYSVT